LITEAYDSALCLWSTKNQEHSNCTM